ncbi:MAG: tRNA uridine-5-carboxymethylaminomethyl(34) synthesis GTPase MnmE [Ostreibacterium sp.]
MTSDSETIAAIATPSGLGGVGVIRVSGHDALVIAEKITGKTLKPRFAHYASFKNPVRETIDQGLVIFFNAPNSYTGEEVVEFQGHGGVAVLQSVLQLILSHGARLARPGEFTERAFLNNKMDLVQAEAVADLIESRSQSAIKAALRSLSGEFSAIINELQVAIIELRVYIEASLDFSEEEIDFLSDGKVAGKINHLLTKVKAVYQKASYGKLLHEGVQVVLVGEPNVGKSSLMNQLLGHERAIVTDQAGTTRDTLEESLLIGDIPVKIIDTAGFRETENVVERAGIARTKAAVQSADLVIWLRDGRTLSDLQPTVLSQVDFIEVHNKADLFEQVTEIDNTTVLTISAKTGQGINHLIDAIADKITHKHSEEGIFSARERHIQALIDVEHHIERAYRFIQSLTSAELVAEELRLAQQALSEITGQYSSDDLLGAIFSSFCVGK